MIKLSVVFDQKKVKQEKPKNVPETCGAELSDYSGQFYKTPQKTTNSFLDRDFIILKNPIMLGTS